MAARTPVRIRHAGLVVADLARALRFYRNVLGLRMERRMRESGPAIEKMLDIPGAVVTTVKLADPDGSLLELLRFHAPRAARPSDKAPRGRSPGGLTRRGFTHVALTVRDLDGLRERLARAGARFLGAPQASPDGRVRVVFCLDPEGNPLELVEVRAPRRGRRTSRRAS